MCFLHGTAAAKNAFAVCDNLEHRFYMSFGFLQLVALVIALIFLVDVLCPLRELLLGRVRSGENSLA